MREGDTDLDTELMSQNVTSHAASTSKLLNDKYRNKRRNQKTERHELKTQEIQYRKGHKSTSQDYDDQRSGIRARQWAWAGVLNKVGRMAVRGSKLYWNAAKPIHLCIVQGSFVCLFVLV